MGVHKIRTGPGNPKTGPGPRGGPGPRATGPGAGAYCMTCSCVCCNCPTSMCEPPVHVRASESISKRKQYWRCMA
eukprot:8796148-Karenia_brevis.AAC.1